MRYFQNKETNEVFGYDEDQQKLIDKALEDGLEEVTDSWPPKTDFQTLQSAALSSIDNYHAQQVQSLVGNPTQVEKDTWSLKLETANCIINNSTLTMASNAFVTGAGLESDADKLDWAHSVIAKSVRYSTFVGVAERQRDDARAAVKAATDEDALNAALEQSRLKAEQAIARLQGGD